MSPRQWCALFCFYTAYLFFGASVFYYTEREYEVERRLLQLQERIEIHELLAKYTAPDDVDVQQDILRKVTTYCGKKVTNHTLDEYVDPYQWTFYHSVFFAFTVCSTLGYGNIAPTQTFGRYFMIVYALVGIPVNGILYAYLGDYFGETFIGAYNRYKDYKIASNKNYVPHRWNMIAQITLYLVPAAVVLIFLPSCLFTYFEGWSYSVSVYYSFVTLSTIGFGDFIPTFQPHQERVFGVWFQLYQAFIIIWLVFGLSYLLMLIGFIARGMRSKQITRLEHQLSENIKLTQQRIWTGVTRDVSYLRKIFNEIYIMRFKPAYDNDDNGYVYNILTRSESCPNIAMYHPHYAHHHHHNHNYYNHLHQHGHHHPHSNRAGGRRRAHSEHDVSANSADLQPPPRQQPNAASSSASAGPSGDGLPPTRRSDADLLRVDRPRALDDPLLSVMHTGDVLARVVQALGAIGAAESPRYRRLHAARHSVAAIHGHHGLSDSQILASECPTPPLRPRLRAASEYRGVSAAAAAAAAASVADADRDPHEWTWSGTHAQIAELRQMRARLAQRNASNDLHRQVVSGAHAISIEISPPAAAAEDVETPRSHHRQPPPGYARNLVPAQSRKNSATAAAAAAELERMPFEPPPEARRYLEKTGGARDSLHADAMRRQYLNATQRGRPSVFAAIDNVDQLVLEQTTIADLIRAIEVAHIQEHVPEPMLRKEPTTAAAAAALAVLKRSPRPPGSEQIGGRRASMFPGFHSCHEARGERYRGVEQTMASGVNEADDDEDDELDEDSEHEVADEEVSAKPNTGTSDVEEEDVDDDNDDDDDDDGPPEPPTSALFHKHQKARRASMFPANYKEFKKLTDTILNDGLSPNHQPHLHVPYSPSPFASAATGGLPKPPPPPPPPIAAVGFHGAATSQRRASMFPVRRPLVPPVAIAAQAAASGGGARSAYGAGRRVSLIPGAGRHAIPERLLREYAHVPRETHALSRQAQRASGRQSRHFLSAPFGGAFAMPISPARRKSSTTATANAQPPPASARGPTNLSVATWLQRDGRTTASSPHLSGARRDSVQLHQPLVQPPLRSNVRHHVFRPFQAAAATGGSESTAAAAASPSSVSVLVPPPDGNSSSSSDE